MLKDGGRLVFFLPSINDDNLRTELPPHPDFELIAKNGQEYNKWVRILVTLRRKPRSSLPDATAATLSSRSKTHLDATTLEFRDHYLAPRVPIARPHT